MTELTPREILDAIRRGLEETARRFAKEKSEQTPRRAQPDQGSKTRIPNPGAEHDSEARSSD
jgi:hypothetical protein